MSNDIENPIVKGLKPTLGQKHDQEKLQWNLIPWSSLKQVVEVLMFGSKKYEKDNWKYVDNGEERYLDAAMRHLISYISGEKNDPESGKNHLAHATCCILFAIWFGDKKSDG